MNFTLIRLITCQFSTLVQSILNVFGPERVADFLDHVHMRLLLCTIELSPAFMGGSANCISRLKAFLSNCCGFHFRIMPVFNVVLHEDPKITDIQYWFSALPFAYREFLLIFYFFVKSFENIMDFRCFITCETIFHRSLPYHTNIIYKSLQNIHIRPKCCREE